jgi:ketosteroid isomerase-like protein
MARDHVEEEAIRGMIDNWYAALGRADAAGLATAYADGDVVESLAPPLLHPGVRSSMPD